VRLAMAVSRLRSRIRIEAGIRSTGIPISQLAVLARIIDDGPTTAAALAAGEHVTQQAIAQSLATLKERGLVAKQADPSDGRKSLVTATAAGRGLTEALTASREEWLAQAIDAAVRPEERALLREATELLERIADVEVHRGGEIR
jgi:DNA-binding MarR family transcriptional regulator